MRCLIIFISFVIIISLIVMCLMCRPLILIVSLWPGEVLIRLSTTVCFNRVLRGPRTDRAEVLLLVLHWALVLWVMEGLARGLLTTLGRGYHRALVT